MLFSRPHIFKLKQQVLKFNDIFCVRWGSPKTDLEANFGNASFTQ